MSAKGKRAAENNSKCEQRATSEQLDLAWRTSE